MRATATMGRCMAVLMLAAVCSPARADDAPDRWRFGEGQNGQKTVSLLATNKLSTAGGALRYSPVLTVACTGGGDPQWRQWLELSDKVSARATAAVRVTVDAGSFDEAWTVRRGGKTLFRDGADAVARLVRANRLALSWRFGLLSGRGAADFDLAGAGRAIGRLAEGCGTALPQ